MYVHVRTCVYVHVHALLHVLYYSWPSLHIYNGGQTFIKNATDHLH